MNGVVWENLERMHLKRWLTALVAIPLLVFMIGFGPRWLFYLFLYLISLLSLEEFYAITSPDLPKIIKITSFLVAFLLFQIIYLHKILLAPAILTLWVFIPMVWYMLNPSTKQQAVTSEIGMAAMGPFYLVIPLAMLILIDIMPNGKIWIAFLLVVIFATDTGGFYFGRFFGKHKLYKAISPKKTWEGAVGSLISSLMFGNIFLKITHIDTFNPKTFALILSLSVISQIGDLSESMLKRNHGIKDSGTILPGHGGILDRIDGLIFSIPILYIYLNLR